MSDQVNASQDVKGANGPISLTAFLLARIAEDEVRATLRYWHDRDCDILPNDAGYTYPCDCGVPERLKAECEAKRRLVDWHGSQHVCEDGLVFPEDFPRWSDDDLPPEPCDVLKILGTIYAGHADYRDEWRP